MKKCLLTLLLLLFTAGLTAHAQSDSRKQTLMIYMCGSNLESSYGSASEDIQEMISAGLPTRDVTILLMTGGSASWSQGFSADETLISELGPRGTRVVWRSGTMNMGSPDTLTELLRFGMTQYPAQEYSLILWDHGGGPLEGVCWDELHGMDHLSLAELTVALDSAQLPQKLAWVGFDACLMSSLEVAQALSPYAHYMIASQETEPACGWNYAFISGLHADADGSDTGRRIVDTYFEGHEGTTDILTLACLDLSAADAACAEMDAAFASLGSQIDASLFTRLSGMRMSTTGFGKAVRGAGDDGYDLVDLRSLTRQLSALMPESSGLDAALDALIVHSRANVPDAGGVSVYHPYVNKDKYIASWKNAYTSLAFSRGYQQYVEQFGAWLTSDALTLWADLTPTASAPDAQGVQLLQMPLTIPQQSELISAQLLILRESVWGRNDNTYTLVGVAPAHLNEAGVLEASAVWPSLYCVDADGVRHGPLSYEMTDDGKYITLYTRFSHDKTMLTEAGIAVMYYLQADPETNEAVISHIRVFDSATQSWTTRVEFDPADYQWIYLSDFDRDLPQPDESGSRPAFWAWERNWDTISYSFLEVGEGFHFELDPICDSDMDLCAMFQITDSQQNVHASQLTPLEIPRRTPLTVLTGAVTLDGVQVSLHPYVSRSTAGRGLWLEYEVTNLSDRDMNWAPSNDVILNDTLCVPRAGWTLNYVETLAPGETMRSKIAIDAQELLDVDEITSITANMQLYPADDYIAQQQMRYEVVPSDVSDITPDADVMASVGVGGVRWELLDISASDYSGVSLRFRIHNTRDVEMPTYSADILLNHFLMNSVADRSTIPANCARVITFDVTNDAFGSFYAEDLDSYTVELSADLLAAYGYDAIHEITILQDVDTYYGEIGGIGQITLAEPYPLPRARKSDHGLINYYLRLDESQQITQEELLPLAENQFCRLELERIFAVRSATSTTIGGDGYDMNGIVYLCLHLTNLSDQILQFEFTDASVSTGDSTLEYCLTEKMMLAPGQRQTISLKLASYDTVSIAPALSTVTLTFKSNLQYGTSQATITSAEPIPWDAPLGTFATAKELTSSYAGPETVRVIDEWQGETAVFMPEVIVPENAAQYRHHMEAWLTPEEAAGVETGAAIALQKNGDSFRLLSHERAAIAPDGSISCDMAGLALTLTGTVEEPIPMGVSISDDGQITLNRYTSLYVYCAEVFSTIAYYDYRLSLAPDSAQAEFVVLDSYGSLPQRQHQITYVLYDTADPLLAQMQSADLPVYDDLVFSKYPVYIPLDNKPAQLTLRPLEEMEDVYIMFTFLRKDGTGFSIPPRPMEEMRP